MSTIAGVAALGSLGFALGVIITAIAAIFTQRWRESAARAQCYGNCACPWRAVSYLGWSGSVNAFFFFQRGYAIDFMRLNLRRLVGLSPEAREILRYEFEQLALDDLRRADNAAFDKWRAKIVSARGPAGRRAGLEGGLTALRQPHMRERVLLEASRIEVSAALEKAGELKSSAAKLRVLREALSGIRSDAVPDELQAQQIRWLEDAIEAIEDEKNSIDVV